MNKCSITAFLIGITITVSSLAFFGQISQMPQQMFKMGSQIIMPQQPQQQPCVCKCN